MATTDMGAWLRWSPGPTTMVRSQHYSLSRSQTRFFEHYGSAASVTQLLDGECAALILELMNFETFEPASPEFIAQIADDCRRKGVLLIVDETRTGLGRFGPAMVDQSLPRARPRHSRPGQGPRRRPVSRERPAHDPAHLRSLLERGALGFQQQHGLQPHWRRSSPRKSIDMIQRPALTAKRYNSLENTAECTSSPRYARSFPHDVCTGFRARRHRHHWATDTRADRDAIQPALFKHGVMCHSVSLIEPAVIKFFPCLTSDAGSHIAELAARSAKPSRPNAVPLNSDASPPPRSHRLDTEVPASTVRQTRPTRRFLHPSVAYRVVALLYRVATAARAWSWGRLGTGYRLHCALLAACAIIPLSVNYSIDCKTARWPTVCRVGGTSASWDFSPRYSS